MELQLSQLMETLKVITTLSLRLELWIKAATVKPILPSSLTHQVALLMSETWMYKVKALEVQVGSRLLKLIRNCSLKDLWMNWGSLTKPHLKRQTLMTRTCSLMLLCNKTTWSTMSKKKQAMMMITKQIPEKAGKLSRKTKSKVSTLMRSKKNRSIRGR